MASPPTPDFERLIAGVSRALEARSVPFMLIGGQAVLLHGEPRLTQDVDITLGIGPDRVDEIIDAAGAAGLRVLPDEPREFVAETFVLPSEERETGLRGAASSVTSSARIVRSIVTATNTRRPAATIGPPTPALGSSCPAGRGTGDSGIDRLNI